MPAIGHDHLASFSLRERDDVIPDRIALQGWSNGGSAALATMASLSAPGVASLTPATGFRGALVFYPACGLKGQFDGGLIPYAPVRVFQGSTRDVDQFLSFLKSSAPKLASR